MKNKVLLFIVFFNTLQLNSQNYYISNYELNIRIIDNSYTFNSIRVLRSQSSRYAYGERIFENFCLRAKQHYVVLDTLNCVWLDSSKYILVKFNRYDLVKYNDTLVGECYKLRGLNNEGIVLLNDDIVNNLFFISGDLFLNDSRFLYDKIFDYYKNEELSLKEYVKLRFFHLSLSLKEINKKYLILVNEQTQEEFVILRKELFNPLLLSIVEDVFKKHKKKYKINFKYYIKSNN